MAASPYARRGDGAGGRRLSVDAGGLWTGGVATALVAAFVALVGVLIARGVSDIPVLAPTGEGTLGNISTARLAAVAALIATGLMHLLLLSTPRPWRFSWIAALLTLIAVPIPFVTDADLDAKVATPLINLAIGIASGSLIPAVARGASRHDRGRTTGI